MYFTACLTTLLCVCQLSLQNSVEQAYAPGWTQLATPSNVKVNDVGVGPAGIWVVTADKDVLSYDDANSQWSSVTGSLKKISVGNVVVGMKPNGTPVRRDGNSWVAYNLTAQPGVSEADKTEASTLNRLFTSEYANDVWGVHKKFLYHRSSATAADGGDAGTFKKDSSDKQFVSGSKYGLWAISATRELYYRSYSDNGDNDAWSRLNGIQASKIAAESEHFVVVYTLSGKLQIRRGVSADTPKGVNWQLVTFNETNKPVKSVVLFRNQCWLISKGKLFRTALQ